MLVSICRFPLGVWEGLRFVIVALPGLFSYLFLYVMFVWSFLVPNPFFLCLGKAVLRNCEVSLVSSILILLSLINSEKWQSFKNKTTVTKAKSMFDFIDIVHEQVL